MKFDKAMEIAYKILAVFTCLALVLGVVSCSKSYIKVSALEISAEEQAGIDDYLQAYSENQAAIDFRLDDDSDGNRSVRLQIFGLQQLALLTQTNIYDNMDFSIAPDSVTVSGSASVGFYYHNGERKTCTVFPVPLNRSFTSGQYYTVAQSDDFQVVCMFDEHDGVQRTYTFGSSVQCRVTPDFGGVTYTDLKNSSFFKDSNVFFYQTNYITWLLDVSSAPIPTFNDAANRALSNYCYTSGFPTQYFCGQGSSVSLPSGSSDTSSPWDYYNDTLLPYLKENYPTYNEYFVFPDGYEPQYDPTEPPNLNPSKPGGGVPIIAPIIVGSGNIINVDGIDFHIYAPIKGQLEIDGITFQFPEDGSNDVFIDRTPYKIPLPEFEYKNHDIAIPDISHIIFDGVTFNINPDGSLTINNDNYPLPIGQPETVSSNDDYLVYKYEIPTIENINIVDAELSAPDLTGFADSIAFISGATMDTLEQLGLVPFVLAMLSIGVFGVCLWKLGG